MSSLFARLVFFSTFTLLGIVIVLNFRGDHKLTRVPELVAHRGVHQNYSRTELDSTTCTAERIAEPSHSYLENTIDSISAAFEFGADYVEIDIYETVDGKLVLFHDEELQCRTNGSGSAHDLTLAEVKALDAGHGYTSDSGNSYPFRGSYFGAIPSFSEVLKKFPQKQFIINQKANRRSTTNILSQYLITNDQLVSDENIFWGTERTYDFLKGSEISYKHMLAHEEMKSCFRGFLVLNWFGVFPSLCRNAILAIPYEYLLYVLPNIEKFVDMAHSNNSEVLIMRVNDIASLEKVLKIDIDYVMTDRIEIIGSYFMAAQKKMLNKN